MTDRQTRQPSRRERAVLRLQSPDDILSAVPFLLRFHPENSFVFLALKGKSLVLTARVDIGKDPIDVESLADHFARVCVQHEGDGLILVAYSDLVARISGVVDDLVEALEPIQVHEALVTDGRSWWSRLDEEGQPGVGIPVDSGSSEVAARAVFAGLPALPNRAALADSVAGPGGADAAELAGVFETVLMELADLSDEERRERICLLVESFCVHRQALTPSECAELAVLSYEIALRDLAAQRIRLEDAELHVELWHQVVANTVAPFESAPLCLLGLAAWVSGNGALMVVCMERAEEVNPDYSLLGVLERINACALPPHAWEGMYAA
ncbi:DUF4192 domain-containing protein [Ammonicoccus fulvus]|uniref:DUF4192 domain-containing protein n=1 Tax=Ammonicoccus fulvus TaxID=3138240 RepID=A0ABZ3FPN7_9ACTN